MRTAFAVSAVLHLLVAAPMAFSLTWSDDDASNLPPAIPVELVTIGDETSIQAGDPTENEVVEAPAERTVEEAPEPPEPAERPGATDEAANMIATAETARPEADLSSSPIPTAEPEPAPTEVAALDQEAVPEPTERTPETVVPSAKPAAPPRRREEPVVEERPQQPNPTRDAFDADRLSQLINRTDGAGGGSGVAQASAGAATGGLDNGLTLTELDAMRTQMQRCWNPPVAVAGASDLKVAVVVRLQQDGSVEEVTAREAEARGGLHAVAADAAKRAVLQCQPYLLPAEKYDAWQAVQVNFDPRQLF